MKHSGKSIVFVLVCIGVLVAAFVIGVCIREIRFGGAGKTVEAPQKSPIELAREREQARRMPGSGLTSSTGNLSPEQRTELVEQRADIRDRFENMTDEEREAFRAQMRERFSGRRRDTGSQLNLTDEQRAQLRKDIDELRANWDQMSEAEREQARNKISDTYGFMPRGFGGDRGFGDGGSGRRRTFMRPNAEETGSGQEQTSPDEEQTEPNEEQSENN